MSTIGAVILAAGRSTRMGSHKLLLPLGDRPVIARVTDAALGAPVAPIVVVLGHHADRVRAALPDGIYTVVDNAHYAEGLATSLHVGITSLPPTVTGTLVLLGDQPLLDATHLAQIVHAAEQTRAPVVAAQYGDHRGHPIYFSRECFADLLRTSGDEGGRTVINRYAAHLELVPFEDDVIGLDLDEPTDYERMRQLWAARHGAD